MNIFQTIILSIVEGISEFLPISSTGHLILASNLLNLNQSEFVKSFEIIIQLGAILAVVCIYFKKLVLSFNIDLYKKVLVAFLPSTVFGLIFYKFIKSYLIGNSYIVILSLFLGGLVMIVFEKYFNQKVKVLSLKSYAIIGLFQVLSMIPGVSRAFATIFGGMFVGLKREEATEFSFFLAIPTMFAATFLDIIKTDPSVWTKSNLAQLGVGFIVSFITAYFSVKILINYVKKRNFVGFGWYRIILSIVFLLFLMK